MSRLATEFWNYVSMAGECWTWMRSKTSAGYGQAVRFGKKLGCGSLAHRIAWVLTKKRPIPKGFVVHHKCENRACVRPGHLELKTDSAHRGGHSRREKPRCGHAYTLGRRCRACRNRWWRERYARSK